MTLRLRLVAALVALLTVGLTIFGVSTYAYYSRSQYDRLDQQLVDKAQGVAQRLVQYKAGLTQCSLAGLGECYGEFRARSTGTVADVTTEPTDEDAELPSLPKVIDFGGHSRFFDVGSAHGGTTHWRVLATPVQIHQRPPGAPPGFGETSDAYFFVLAMPTSSVESALNRLAVTELVAAGVLLALVAVGAWLVLRQGLRPLEKMAATAGTLTAGQLDTRVEPADEHTEVGQLGLALNTMLSRLEGAFAEREATEHKLRQFLADASHELRTPLTSIQGFAELFRLGAEDDQVDLAVTMRRIEEESHRMRVLVDDLLLLARLDQTRPIEKAPVDLAVVAADACSDAVAVDPDRAVTLDAPEPVVVEGDNDHLRQAVGNLVTNAMVHTPAGTPVTVAARAANDAAFVIVRDHGPGLAPEALSRAFDRFWQADSSRSDEGSGLGLSIVAGIAKEHGGTAWAANAVDGGAVFTIRLPLMPPASPGSTAEEPPEDAPVAGN